MKAKEIEEVEPYRVYETEGVFKYWHSYPLDINTNRKEFMLRISEFDFYVAEQEGGNWVWLIENRMTNKFLSSFQVDKFIPTAEMALESFLNIGLTKFFSSEKKIQALKNFIACENKSYGFTLTRCREILAGKDLPLVSATKVVEIRKEKFKDAMKYKGVVASKLGCTFVVSITHDYKRIYLGSYKCPIEAAKAYDKAAIFYKGYGNWIINFPDDWKHLENN